MGPFPLNNCGNAFAISESAVAAHPVHCVARLVVDFIALAACPFLVRAFALPSASSSFKFFAALISDVCVCV